MIQNYLAVTIRGMTRNKAFTAVKILGLAASVACALLVSHYVRFELSFDTHHTKADRYIV